MTLDDFYCSGAVSGDGWVWSTAGRTSDYTEKMIAVNYAGRGVSYDFEGMNRNINVAQPTSEQRRAVNPAVPDDPDLLPGTADVAALDGPGGERGKGYIWDAGSRPSVRDASGRRRVVPGATTDEEGDTGPGALPRSRTETPTKRRASCTICETNLHRGAIDYSVPLPRARSL